MSGSNAVNQVPVYGTQGVPAPGNTPGSRANAATWTDSSGHFWLYGGNVFYTESGGAGVVDSNFNDLWEYDPATNLWTWVSGSSTPDQPGVYGTLGVPSASNFPGCRHSMVSWMGGNGHFWLFGGLTCTGPINDLWEYDPSTNQWTWQGGSSSTGQAGKYGTLGTPDVNNIPGARYVSTGWADSSGHFWLFGGAGVIGMDGADTHQLNDLWEYNPTAKTWTWVSGSNTWYAQGVYGTLGSPAPSNVPGARYEPASWIDSSGNFWIFAGIGQRASANPDFLNDLWKFDPTTRQWTWMGGSSTTYEAGVYGTLGVPSPLNVPGSRFNSVSWIDSNGKLLLFGGENSDAYAPPQGFFNDLWRFDPATNQWTWMSGSNATDPLGNFGTLGIPALSNAPSGRYSPAAWKDNSGHIWIFGGYGHDPAGNYGYLSDVWKYGAEYYPATMKTPISGSQITGSSATFTWDPGVNVTSYSIYVGTTPGAHDIAFVNTSKTSALISNLPTNGAKLYVTLYSLIKGVWQAKAYTYYASGAAIPATMTSPSSGTKLSGSSQLFSWTTGVGVSAYSLYIGTKAGLHDIAYVNAGSSTSVTVNGLPTNGGKFYVTLYSLSGTKWLGNSYNYIASGTGTASEMSSPAPGTKLAATSQTFTWTAGVGINSYSLYIGTTRGAHDLYFVNTSGTSTNVTGLPSNGTTLYVTLYSLNGSTWLSHSYTYTAVGP